jgi:hypothetical protein
LIRLLSSVTRPAQANDATATAATLSPESTVLFSDALFDVVAPRVVPVRAVAGPAVAFPYKPCRGVKRLTKISPFFKHCGSTSLPRIAAYVFCFMSGASVRFSRHLAGIHHNATVTRLNTAMSAMCVAENFRQFVGKDKGNWAEIQG